VFYLPKRLNVKKKCHFDSNRASTEALLFPSNGIYNHHANNGHKTPKQKSTFSI